MRAVGRPLNRRACPSGESASKRGWVAARARRHERSLDGPQSCWRTGELTALCWRRGRSFAAAVRHRIAGSRSGPRLARAFLKGMPTELEFAPHATSSKRTNTSRPGTARAAAGRRSRRPANRRHLSRQGRPTAIGLRPIAARVRSGSRVGIAGHLHRAPPASADPLNRERHAAPPFPAPDSRSPRSRYQGRSDRRAGGRWP